MKTPTYLILSRHNIYYFRYPLSARLHPQGKVSYIKLSLETRCPRLALRLCRLLSTIADNLLSNPRVWYMDYIEIRDLLSKHFKKLFENRKAEIHKDGRLTTFDKAVYGTTMTVTSPPLEVEEDDMYAHRENMLKMINRYSLTLEQGTKEYEMFRAELSKAAHAYAKSVLEYDASLDTYDLNTPEAITINQATVENKNKKLIDFYPKYIEDKILTKEWDNKFAKEATGYFKILVEFIGEDSPLHLSTDATNEIKMMLLQLPKYARSHNALKAMTIKELVALPADHPSKKRKMMQKNSIRKYITTYSGFYDWAVTLKHVNENNFKDINIEADKSKKKDAFTSEQINLIMPAILGEQKPHYRWGALMLRYTGARKEEIAQLRVTDVRQENDIWYFDIEETNEEDDNSTLQPKKLKNTASKRKVPIHSKLIELGIMEYIQKAAIKQDGRILHELTYSPTNGYGRNLSRWFNETLLVDLDIKTSRLSMHSLRHTAITEMINNGAQEPIVKRVVGHTVGGVTHSSYFSGYTMAQLKEAVEKIG